MVGNLAKRNDGNAPRPAMNSRGSQEHGGEMMRCIGLLHGLVVKSNNQWPVTLTLWPTWPVFLSVLGPGGAKFMLSASDLALPAPTDETVLRAGRKVERDPRLAAKAAPSPAPAPLERRLCSHARLLGRKR